MPTGTVESTPATPCSSGGRRAVGGARRSWRPARPVRVFGPCTYLLALCVALCKESPDFWVPRGLLSVGRGQDHTAMPLTFDLAPGPRVAFQPPELWGVISRLMCSSHGKLLYVSFCLTGGQLVSQREPVWPCVPHLPWGKMPPPAPFPRRSSFSFAGKEGQGKACFRQDAASPARGRVRVRSRLSLFLAVGPLGPSVSFSVAC